MFHHQIKFFISFGGEREEITNPTGRLLGLGTLASIVNDQEVLFTSKDKLNQVQWLQNKTYFFVSCFC